MDMLEDKIIDLLSKKTKCPVCGEECISWYKKGFYTNFWKFKKHQFGQWCGRDLG